MAIRYHEYLEAGAIVAGVVVDSPQQNAAMGEKLSIPFALLSDPDRSVAIGPYGVADPKDHREIATPTTVVIDPEGNEVWRRSSVDFADRPEEDEALEVVRDLGLPPILREPVNPLNPVPGPKAMPLNAMPAYYRGARFAAVAMGRRHPVAKGDADTYVAQMDRYLDAVRQIRD